MVGPGSVSGWATKILYDVWPGQKKKGGGGIPELCGQVLSTQKQRSVYPPLTCSKPQPGRVLETEVPNSMEKRCHQVSSNVVSSPRQDAARLHLGGLNRVLRGPS